MYNKKEARRKYYLAHKEHERATNKAWIKGNAESVNARNKQYQEDHPWYKTRSSIWHRCNNPKHQSYKYYGGRGIKMLITTKELEYLWGRDKAHLMKHPSIDRKDVNGHYCLENCRYLEMGDNVKRRFKKEPG